MSKEAEFKKMNVWQRYAEAKLIVKNTNFKKEGKNNHNNYRYFKASQIDDLTFAAMNDTGLCSDFDLLVDERGHYGKLVIVNIDNPDDRITKIWRTDIPQIPATNSAQKLGGAGTYIERYMKSSAFGIADDNLDFDADKTPTPPTPTPPAKKTTPAPSAKKLIPLIQFTDKANTIESDNWKKCVDFIKGGGDPAKLRTKYSMTPEQVKILFTFKSKK